MGLLPSFRFANPKKNRVSLLLPVTCHRRSPAAIEHKKQLLFLAQLQARVPAGKTNNKAGKPSTQATAATKLSNANFHPRPKITLIIKKEQKLKGRAKLVEGLSLRWRRLGSFKKQNNNKKPWERTEGVGRNRSVSLRIHNV